MGSAGDIGGGTISGATTGASLGSVGGPWGAGIGAGIGGLAGLLGGIFGGGRKKPKAAYTQPAQDVYFGSLMKELANWGNDTGQQLYENSPGFTKLINKSFKGAAPGIFQPSGGGAMMNPQSGGGGMFNPGYGTGGGNMGGYMGGYGGPLNNRMF